MSGLLTLVGVVVFLIGLMLSIALHEVGHLVPAKRFDVRVTQYMVGFGRTVWSRRRGETEYGLKAIPFGGYVRMVGMFPPDRPGEDSRHLRRASTGPFQALVEDARRASKDELRPGDEDRVFYRKPWWQKLIIMLGGPMMNVLIAVVLAGIVLTTYGTFVLTPKVSAVSECIIPAGEDRSTCRASDPAAPAAGAGFLPGDVIVSFDGERVDSWEQVSQGIRAHGAGPVEVVVIRQGEEVALRPDLAATLRPEDPTDLRSDLVEVGFLGLTPTQVREQQTPAEAITWVGDFAYRSARAVLGIPARMVGVWDAAFGGGERDPNGPIGIVGAGRIGGEIASDERLTVTDRVATFVMLLASFNMAIAIFNLVPLLPLDGGHAAGAIWEAIRRGIARLRQRPDPGYVDVAKGLPVAYTVATLLIGMSALLLYADIVNPVRLSG